MSLYVDNIQGHGFTACGEFEYRIGIDGQEDIMPDGDVVISVGNLCYSTRDEKISALVAGCLTYEQRDAIVRHDVWEVQMWYANNGDYEAETLPELVQAIVSSAHESLPDIDELYFEDATGNRSIASKEARYALHDACEREFACITEEAGNWQKHIGGMIGMPL